MGVQVNVDKAVSDYYKKGGTTKFENSLKKILTWAGDDDRINKIEHLAYLLGTAKAESDFSLERWESDYVCGKAGVKYKDKPCEKALNYYKSDAGDKKNYYTLGLDSRGLPYFGRGLIQLTGKENYKKYGDIIGVNLVDDPEKVFVPQNSYNIAVSFLTDKGKDGTKKSTFERVDAGDLTSARRSVNGGERDLSKVNEEYKKWVDILKSNSEVVSASNKRVKRIVGVGVVLATIGITGIVVYLILKKTGKLPNFLKKVNL
jgi:predicted chitinase